MYNVCRRWTGRSGCTMCPACSKPPSDVWQPSRYVYSSVVDTWHFGYGSGSADPYHWLPDLDPVMCDSPPGTRSTHTHLKYLIFSPVLWIRDILVRTRIRGSVPLTFPGPDPSLFIRDFQDAIKNFSLRIFEVMVRWCIPLTNGSGSKCGSESYYFRQWPSRPF